METTTQPARSGVEDYVFALARLDKRTKNLVKRLKPGEIAIIDHTDIDRVSAESLIESRPAFIINANFWCLSLTLSNRKCSRT